MAAGPAAWRSSLRACSSRQLLFLLSSSSLLSPSVSWNPSSFLSTVPRGAFRSAQSLRLWTAFKFRPLRAPPSVVESRALLHSHHPQGGDEKCEISVTEKSGHCRILVADKMEQQVLEQLQSFSDVDYKPSLGTIGIIEEGGRDVNVLVVRSTKVTADVFDSLQGLKLVIRAGSGVDNIDLNAARKAGVKVANCPGANADAVAELTWGLILACDRGIVEQTGELKEGKWRKGKHSGRSRGLKGRKMGIIGFGRIGREVAARARGFGMSLVVWNRSPLKHVEEDVLVCEDVLQVAREADVISVHVGATEKPLLDQSFFESMQEDAIFVNVARGNVIDEDALLSAMDKKNIRAGLDVFQHEPALAEANFSSKLAAHPSVVCTHHIGAATTQAQAAVGQLVVEIVKEFDRTGEVLHAVK